MPGMPLAFKANFAQFETLPCTLGVNPALGARRLRSGFYHADAVDRAWRHAQLAADAVAFDHSVHQPGCADDRVERARLDAQRAADAKLLRDYRDGR